MSRIAPLLTVLALTAALDAQDGDPGPPEIHVILSNGDTLTGTVIAESETAFTIFHPVLGDLVVPKDGTLQSADDEIRIDLPTPPPPPEPERLFPGWEGTFDFGVTGSEGNADRSNYRTQIRAQHEDEESILTLGLLHQYATEDDAATQDEYVIDARHEWLEPGSPWRTFVQSSLEKDRFREFDYRLAVGGGRSYAFRDDDVVTKVGRVGLGVSKEFGSDDDDVRLEGILGLDYTRVIDDRNKFISSVQVQPALNDLGEYRGRGSAAWETKVADDAPWYFRAGVDADYDSDPDDATSLDWTYFFSLGRSF